MVLGRMEYDKNKKVIRDPNGSGFPSRTHKEGDTD